MNFRDMFETKDMVVSSHEEALDAIKAFQDETSSKYVSVTTQKHYGKVQFDFNLDHKKIRWQLKCRHSIPYDGVPFIFLGKRVLQCHLGPDRQAKLKKARRLEKERKDDNPNKKPYARSNTTKKMDCPAEVSIKCVAKFPDYAVRKDTSRLRKSAASTLRRDLASKGSRVAVSFSYHVHLPGTNEHKRHDPSQPSGIKEPLAPEIKEKIHELVTQGVSSVKEMERRLDSFIKEEILPTDSNLSPQRYRYNPTSSDIRSQIRRAKAANSGQVMSGKACPVAPWSDRMWENVKTCSAFQWEGDKRIHYRPFFVNGVQVGIVPTVVFSAIASAPNLFLWANGGIHLSPSLTTHAERTARVAEFLEGCRQANAFITLQGWRNENYAVSRSFYDSPLLEIERSAACLFGIKQYGVHVNGYCTHPSQGLCLWIAKRSPTKQTYPNKLDNIAAGGLPAGMSPKECMMKESEEEASIPRELSSRGVSVGAISYFFEDERGLFPETQFVFDLELPPDFEPKVCDGEVSEFYLWPLKQVKEEIALDTFKPNCGLICLDFLMRHGYITPDEEPHYLDFTFRLHQTQF